MLPFMQTFIRVLAVGVIALISYLGLKSEPTPIVYENKEPPATSSKARTQNPATTTPVSNISKASTTTTPSAPTKLPQLKPTPSLINPPENKGRLEITVSQNLAPIAQNILPQPSSLNELNDEVRATVVNILCTTISGGTLKPITGSGVIIDKRGVILTNAHIAQYFLLRDFPVKNNVDCIIRTGSPAYPKYRASLLFISPAWIEANHKNIVEQNPLGTGENDFGLLLIDSVVDPNAILPSSFPDLAPNTEEMLELSVANDTYVVAGYPAGFLGGIAVIKDLFVSSTVAHSQKVYTFKENSVDLISLGGSVLAQKGASGGAVVRQSDKKLVGIIVTTTEEKTTGERDLRAVTTTHINRSLYASANISLPELLLKSNLTAVVAEFQVKMFPQLKAILVNDLTTQN
ncbi:MAG: serine protease [bacterium]|nr:serine protease [bacterium]